VGVLELFDLLLGVGVGGVELDGAAVGGEGVVVQSFVAVAEAVAAREDGAPGSMAYVDGLCRWPMKCQGFSKTRK
jgi:hypothetical protein